MSTPARWRSVTATVLAVLAAVLAPLAVTGLWVEQRILDTDGYVETVAPLADDPVVLDALATRIVDELFAVADVEDRITDVLPGPTEALGRSFSASLRNLAVEQTERVLRSDAFQRLWEQANRIAHEQVVAMFSGEGDAVARDDDRIVLDLGVVADRVRERLVDRGVGILQRVSIPDGVIEVTLLQSDLIPELQTVFRVLDDVAPVLPIAFAVVVVAALAVAPRRRRMLVGLGLGVAATTALVLVALDLGRRETVSEAGAADLDADATKAVYDSLVSALRDWSWFVIAAALFVTLVAVVSSPQLAGRLLEPLRGRAAVGSLARWVRARRPALVLGTVALALVALLVWPTPTALVVAIVVLVAAFVLAVITALARAGRSAAPEAAGPSQAVDQRG